MSPKPGRPVAVTRVSPSVTGQHTKVGQCGGPLEIAKLGAIAASELGIPVEIMAVRLAQLVRRRDVLAPVVEVGPLFAEPPRPQPVNEHPLPVVGLWRV